MHKHTHRLEEKTAENRFLQNQAVDADEAPAQHAQGEYVPPPLPPATDAIGADDTPHDMRDDAMPHRDSRKDR